MSVYDGVPDHEELRTRAMARVRRGRLVVMSLVLLCALTVAVTTVITADASQSPAMTLVLLLPVAVLIVIVGAAYSWIRRQDRDPQLVAGADTVTRKAVQRALQTGTAPDARIDALTRDAAARNLRRTGWLWGYGGGVAVQLVGAVLLAIDGSLTATEYTLFAVMGTCAAVVFGSVVVSRRRCHRYLRRTIVE